MSITIAGELALKAETQAYERVARWHNRMAKLCGEAPVSDRKAEEKYWHLNAAKHVRSMKLKGSENG